MKFYQYQLAIFVVLWLFVSETTPLCCHLPYMQSLPCGLESKSVSELKLLEPTDKGRAVGMPSSIDIITDMIEGLCSYALCSSGYIRKEGVFCATGPCNIFGCNCDGECINGKYVDDYLKRLRQETNNTKLTYEFLSRVRRSIKSPSKKIDLPPDSHTSTHFQPSNSATPDRNPSGSSIGYNNDRDKHLFDYNVIS